MNCNSQAGGKGKAIGTGQIPKQEQDKQSHGRTAFTDPSRWWEHQRRFMIINHEQGNAERQLTCIMEVASLRLLRCLDPFSRLLVVGRYVAVRITESAATAGHSCQIHLKAICPRMERMAGGAACRLRFMQLFECS